MKKRFDVIKTVQLILLVLLTAAALFLVFRSGSLYSQIASDAGIRALSLFLWLALGLSYAFLLYDFSAYTDMKRENAELDNAIYSDALTGIANRYSVDVYIGRYLNRELPPEMGVVTFDLTNLSELNERLGHSGGDEAIQTFSGFLQNAARGSCFIGRNGGNKFVAIFRECSENRLKAFTESVGEQVRAHNEKQPEAQLSYSCGIAFDEGAAVCTLTELVALSDRRAYEKSLKES